ncbi:MAG TPA: hypothetical protein DCM07_18860 [Planctomycetaceae bacterium]|nr:hypothetical protein [Planctomycetaceae bacterium]|tara:strand:+ start:1323 stop:2426 length:1104 start_codon:yes stop_codon:yes gene_type:complete
MKLVFVIMTKLRFHTEVTPAFLAETGRPAGGFRRQDGEIVALCTEFGLLYWPARAIYDGHHLQYRVSLYSKDLKTRIGVFDNARYPINDIAFHPSQPMMAIGTGAYDGGYMFEGDLWLWNWETGESRSLLGEFREVVQCRFVDNKHLAITMRPRHEEEFEGKEDEVFNTYVGLIINDFCNKPKPLQGKGDPRLDDLTPLDPKNLGFLSPPISVNERHQRFVDIIGEVNGYEERARVWDIHWMSENQIALVHDNCHVEVWNTNGKREYRQVGEGFGVQILDASEGPLVHVICRANYLDKSNDRSTLFRLDTTGLRQLHSFDRAVVLSCDRSDNILCRDTGNEFGEPKRLDQLLTSGCPESGFVLNFMW